MPLLRPETSVVYTSTPRSPRRSAFTLVEMLVVVGIIGILIGLLFPALAAVRQAARKSYCSANLRQVILATLTHETSTLTFPAGDNGQGGGLIIGLLPFLKQEYLTQLESESLAPGQTYNDRLNEMTELELEVLVCPASSTTDSKTTLADAGDFTTHYYGISGPTGTASASDGSNIYTYKQFSPISSFGSIGLQGLFSPNSSGQFVGRKMTEIRDGTSYTFGFGEISGFDRNAGPGAQTIPKAGWAFGANYDSQGRVNQTFSVKSVGHAINSFEGELNDYSFSSNHPSGAQFALIDGAVRYVDARVSLDILKTFCSMNEVEKPETLDGTF